MLVSLVRRTIPRPIRNALRRPGTSFRRLKAKTRHLFGDCDVVEPRPGWQIRCHPLCPDEFAVFRTHEDQSAELDDFIAHCSSGMKLLDVGAHWGFFSLAATRFGGARARALAIEPSPSACVVLRQNLKLNGAEPTVTLVNSAAGDTS